MTYAKFAHGFFTLHFSLSAFSQRVNIKINRHRFVPVVLQNGRLSLVKVKAHFGQIDAKFKLYNHLSDVHRLYARHRRLVRA